MMKKVRMRAADSGRDRFERDGLWALFKQEQPGSLQCGGSALFGVEAFAAY